ncbi:MAG: hypothetical protein C4547_12760 [Phycisphaerales bacterium]|nr:MAG: hypothetical protein C4547_12760 [Phycisphaerales bacterium]
MLTLLLTIASLSTAAPVTANAPAVGDGPEHVDVRVLSIAENRFKDLTPRSSDGSVVQVFSSWNQDRNTLTVALGLRGRPVTAATHYGRIALKGASFDGGAALTLNADFKVGFTDPRTEFVQIDRDSMYFGRPDASADQIIVELKFDLPPRKATRIEKLTGVIELRTGDTRELTIDGIASKPGAAIENSALRAAGVTLTVADPKSKQPGFFMSGAPGKSVTLKVSGNVDALLDAELIDADGEPLYASRMTSTGEGATVIVLEDDADLPPTTRLKLRVAVDQKTIPVPFDLKSIELP